MLPLLHIPHCQGVQSVLLAHQSQRPAMTTTESYMHTQTLYSASNQRQCRMARALSATPSSLGDVVMAKSYDEGKFRDGQRQALGVKARHGVWPPLARQGTLCLRSSVCAVAHPGTVSVCARGIERSGLCSSEHAGVQHLPSTSGRILWLARSHSESSNSKKKLLPPPAAARRRCFHPYSGESGVYTMETVEKVK